MSIYLDWGFMETPFLTNALSPDEIGETLLIGRESELRKIKTRLSTPPNIITIEGDNGVGKTSLLNIAIYKMYKEYVNTRQGDLFIPCDDIFQITEETNTEDFIDQVLMSVAQTLLKRKKELEELGYQLNNSIDIDSYLNAPQINTYSGSVQASGTGFGVGIGAGKNSVINTNTAFLRSGFRIKIIQWLSEVFQYGKNGGVVCILDNIELLQTCDKARKQLEELRDKVLNYTGIKWVLCGSLGLVSGVVSTKRLEGRMHAPIEITGINSHCISEVLSSRIKAYAPNPETCYLPITPVAFEHLYETLHKNLRNTLNYANEYCMWIYDQESFPTSKEEKHNKYYEWLHKKSDSLLKSVRDVGNKKLDTLKKCISFGEDFSLSDYEQLGFNKADTMRTHIADLEKYSLVSRSIDDGDKRRKTIEVTSRGYFVCYALGRSPSVK
jgi:hypothetical protein